MSAAALLRDASRAGVRLFCRDGRLGFELLDGAFPEELRARIIESRAALIAHLSSAAEEEADTPPLRPVPRDGGTLPASFGQERLWFLDRMAGGSAQYNMPVALRVRGAFDPDLAEQALQRVIDRHEVLRTALVEENGACRQRICAAARFGLRRIDIGNLSGDAREAALQDLVDTDAVAPFDLGADLKLRATFVRLADGDAALLLNVHHIAGDGWSLDVLRREFLQQYAALARGLPDPLPPLPLQYADYALWQRDWLRGEVLERELGYWETQLADLPALHNLPLDHIRPAQQDVTGAVLSAPVGAATLAGLRRLAAEERVTLFMLLHAAFAVLLARLSGEGDVVVGTPVAARPRDELGDLIGYFANTLVLRTDCSDDLPFLDFLRRVRDTHLDAQSHQALPFELLVERLKPVRSASHTPLFQIMFSIDYDKPSGAAAPAAGFETLTARGAPIKFDLLLVATVQAQGLRLDFEYATALFDAATIERMAGRMVRLLDGIVADPRCTIHKLPLLGTDERRQVLEAFQGEVLPYPEEATIATLFEAQAARTPDAPALADVDLELSYAVLNRSANRLAHLLRARGVGAGSLVGVCLPRSARMVVALLAILKAGGAYVPLDPNYPDARLDEMAEDSDIAWLLTEDALLPRLAALPVLGRAATARLALDTATLSDALAGQPDTDPAPLAGPEDPAYLIYTSGSTGRPKAVQIRHRNAAAMIAWGGRAFDAAELRRVLCCTSLNFDLSVFELFVPLSHGGTVVVVENALALLEHTPDISLLNTVPSACRMLVDAGAIPSGVRVVNLAGEALAPALVDDLLAVPGVERVCNLYGPSEDTTYSSWISYTASPGAAVSIGRPLDNTRFYILDAHGQPVPVGVAGEIHIAGAGVALGYLNRPELTAERFLPDPFAEGDGRGRMYRTGDLGRWRADGTIDYLGRNDFQVKVRGFRIELGEIEARLAACPGVREAVVVARPTGSSASGQQRLVAYLTADEAQADQDALLAAARSALREALPDYMQPAAWMLLPALPLTANGKVDRKALPAPRDDDATGQVEPCGALERLIAAVWQECMGLARIGADDNFFLIGGHSILAARIVARLNGLLGAGLSLRQLFMHSSVRALAADLEANSLVPGELEEVAATCLDIMALSADEVRAMLAEEGRSVTQP